MKILPKTRVRVGHNDHLWVTNHFVYTDFGVRQSGEMRAYGRRYVSPSTPGTGFMEHDSESHSYHMYVRELVAKERPNYWRMVCGKEPDYDRELKLARKALAVETDAFKREILDCYVNALSVGGNVQRMERVVRAIKEKLHRHKHNKYYVSVASHYKSRVSQIGRDMSAVEYHLKDHYPPEVMEAYYRVCDAFEAVAKCRRIWHYDEKSREHFKQVFFDFGIFDFIRSDSFLPIMRDGEGVHYYLLPDCFIVARGSLDFDIVPLKDMTIVTQELAIEETVEVVSRQLGDAASMIRIPDLNLTFYFNHVRAIVAFVHAIDELKKML